MEMKCPRCGQRLFREFHQGKIRFRCEEGHGCALTLPAIRSLCGHPAFANMLWHKAMEEPEGGGGACPQCGRAMSLIHLYVEGRALELDICCRCQEVWFDPNELEALPKPPPPPKKAELPAKAREILALHEISEMEERASKEPETPWQYLAGFLGFPVEKGAPQLSRHPWCTWSIAAICVVVFALTCLDLSSYVQEYGLIPGDFLRDGGITLITSMFLHGGCGHLLGNLYFLLIFGDNVEDVLGTPKYLLLLLASGLSAAMLHIALFPASMVPCIGASGFISGIIAAYAVFFPKVTLSLFLRLRWTFFGYWIGIPAWGAFVIWMLLQLVMAIFTSTEGAGVAYGAHLGGAILGLVSGLFWRNQVLRRVEDSNRARQV